MAGFYDEVERVFTFGLDWKIGRNLNAFNDILRGGFGRHEYGQPIHIQWLAYEKSVRNLGKETMDTIVEIILDTDHSGHDCIKECPEITVTWFRPDEKKDGGQYITTTGRLRRIDEFNQVLILVDDIKIPLTHVVDLDSEKLPDMNQMEW